MTSANGVDPDVHLQELRAGEEEVDHVEEVRMQLLGRGRAAMGVTGSAARVPLLRALRENHVGLYTVVALGLLVVVDSFQGIVVGTLGPEIAHTLGLTKSELASILLLKSLALTVMTLVVADLVRRVGRRGLVAIVTGFAWSAATLLTGFVTGGLQLAGLAVADGATSASVTAVHFPLLMDAYPATVRVRVISLYALFLQLTGIVAPLAVAALVGPLDLTWRGALVATGLLSLLVAVFSIGLRDRGFGRFDSNLVRAAVRRQLDPAADQASADAGADESEAELGFFEIVRRLLMMPTVRLSLVSTIVAGMLAIPFSTFFTFYLADHWHLSPPQRALFSAGTPVLALIVIPIVAARGERLFRADPGNLLRLSALLQLFAIASIAVAVMSPTLALVFLGFAASQAFPAAIGPAVGTGLMAIIPPRMRPHLIALYGLAGTGAGGIAGLLLLGGLDARIGESGALLAMTLPGIIPVLITLRAARYINQDLDRTVSAVIEQEELSSMRRGGSRLPMLACRHVNFAYGSLQVLFDVDFTVDAGEMVALLGTNGAGKSTLLRVIAGVGLPTSGSVRLDGTDITYVDAERRVRMGITQVPGGRAVFAPLTVVENLRVFGYAHGNDRRAVDRGIEESFAAFPRLGERRNQAASTLSGGEQQMLGLSKALMLKPRLLCIDELSLGLAPKIVAELLEMVRRINQAGTAVVLVEQSATIALSLVDHAYFMERGQVRFDGAAAELLAREDLLRSVFLQGAAAGAAALGTTG